MKSIYFIGGTILLLFIGYIVYKAINKKALVTNDDVNDILAE